MCAYREAAAVSDGGETIMQQLMWGVTESPKLRGLQRGLVDSKQLNFKTGYNVWRHLACFERIKF